MNPDLSLQEESEEIYSDYVTDYDSCSEVSSSDENGLFPIESDPGIKF